MPSLSAGTPVRGVGARAPVRPRKRDGRHSGDVLLDAASGLMIERNSITVTFNEIAARAGLNSALIHYRFGGKSGLFRALISRDVGGTFPMLEDLVAADLPAEEKLTRHIQAIIKTYFEHPYLNRLIAALSQEVDGEGARFISERVVQPLARAQAAILAQGEAEGVFRHIDPMLFYFSLIGACDHLFQARYALKWAFGVPDIDDALRRDYARHVIALLLDSVRA
ncbi:MAG: TetR family transcriptional regulator [Sphingomonas adhaesiva]|uniref:TetR family transcriptional regulator n=1 Tax=Sphingomonas adhaesiva TaxID=28212 RepID=UPI002FF77B5F